MVSPSTKKSESGLTDKDGKSFFIELFQKKLRKREKTANCRYSTEYGRGRLAFIYKIIKGDKSCFHSEMPILLIDKQKNEVIMVTVP
jgi:hypothetical protein